MENTWIQHVYNTGADARATSFELRASSYDESHHQTPQPSFGYRKQKNIVIPWICSSLSQNQQIRIVSNEAPPPVLLHPLDMKDQARPNALREIDLWMDVVMSPFENNWELEHFSFVWREGDCLTAGMAATEELRPRLFFLTWEEPRVEATVEFQSANLKNISLFCLK